MTYKTCYKSRKLKISMCVVEYFNSFQKVCIYSKKVHEKIAFSCHFMVHIQVSKAGDCQGISSLSFYHNNEVLIPNLQLKVPFYK